MNESPMDCSLSQCSSTQPGLQICLSCGEKVVNKVTISLSSLKCVSHIGRLLKTETEIY